MKKSRFLIVLLGLLAFAIGTSAQAHLGATYAEIKAYHPEKTYTYYKDADVEYYSTEFVKGTMLYYMTEGVCYMCGYFMNSLGNANLHAEQLNSKYVIVSATKWRGYLEGGGVIDIELKSISGVWVFVYTNA